jgi:hypothetical protein
MYNLSFPKPAMSAHYNMQIQVSEVVGVGDGHGGFWVRSGTLLDRQEGWDGGWGGGCGGKMISGVGIDTGCWKNEFVLDKILVLEDGSGRSTIPILSSFFIRSEIWYRTLRILLPIIPLSSLSHSHTRTENSCHPQT